MSGGKVAISDLGRVVTGKTPSTKNAAFFDGEYPFVTPSDLNWKTYYCHTTERTVTDDARKSLLNQFVPSNAVMVTCIGNTIGKCGLSSSDCLTNQQINSIIPSEGIDPKFVYYLLVYNTDSIRGVGLGGDSATPILNKMSFSKIKLRVPPQHQWVSIAKKLSAYDDLIENNRRRIQLLEQAARLLCKEWFVHLRFPGHEHTQIIDGVPKGWEKKVLGDLCFEVRETVSPSALEANTPYIGLEHMPRRSITLCEWGQAVQVTSSKHRYREGEILFGKIRPYFHKVGIALTDGVASSDAIIIRPLNLLLLPLVLMTTSSDGFVTVTAQQMKEGSKMPRADWKQMQQYPFPLPPDGLLCAFNDLIDPILNQLKTLAFSNKRLGAARDLLLPKLMNGEVAV
jgi:type I restriction enzyme S subunit